jgi:HSP20 family molecular chaperone IbpA
MLRLSKKATIGGTMDTQQPAIVPVRTAETIIDEIEDMYDRITKRAYEIFLERGGTCTLDLDDWLTAERELLWKPDVHVEDTNQHIVVTIRLGAICPPDVRLTVSPLAMLVQADASATTKKVFRTVEFPRRIDVHKAEARYADGYVTLTA